METGISVPGQPSFTIYCSIKTSEESDISRKAQEEHE